MKVTAKKVDFLTSNKKEQILDIKIITNPDSIRSALNQFTSLNYDLYSVKNIALIDDYNGYTLILFYDKNDLTRKTLSNGKVCSGCALIKNEKNKSEIEFFKFRKAITQRYRDRLNCLPVFDKRGLRLIDESLDYLGKNYDTYELMKKNKILVITCKKHPYLEKQLL